MTSYIQHGVLDEDQDNEESYLILPRTLDNKNITVEEAIEHIGYGRFQIQLSLMCGFALMAESMEMMILSILGPVLVCEWQLDSTREALITTVVFSGFFIGSPLIGIMTDKYGRQAVLGLTAAWGSYFGLLSGLAPRYIWLLFLRFLAGIGIAGSTQISTYIVEFLPSKSRGRTLLSLEMFYALGGSMEIVLALGVLQTIGWHWWIIISALPLGFFSIICIYFLPTSPRFLIASGNLSEASATLQQMAVRNGMKMLEGSLISPKKCSPRGYFRDLFRSDLCRTTILLYFIYFSVLCSYFGTILFTTELIRLPDISFHRNVTNEAFSNCPVTCKGLSSSDYIEMLWTSVAELPGVLLTIGVIDKIGRKWTLGILCGGYGICCLLLCIVMPHTLMLTVLFIARGMIAGAGQGIFLYTAEVYPTEIRGLAIGTCSAISRIGSLITPFLAQVLLRKSLHLALILYGALGILTSVAVALLPYETNGREI